MVTHCCLEDRPLFLIRFGVPSALCVKLPVHTLTPTANQLTEALKQGRELAVCMLDSVIFCLLFYLKYLEIHVNKHPQYFPDITSTRSSHLSIKHLGFTCYTLPPGGRCQQFQIQSPYAPERLPRPSLYLEVSTHGKKKKKTD